MVFQRADSLKHGLNLFNELLTINQLRMLFNLFSPLISRWRPMLLLAGHRIENATPTRIHRESLPITVEATSRTGFVTIGRVKEQMRAHQDRAPIIGPRRTGLIEEHVAITIETVMEEKTQKVHSVHKRNRANRVRHGATMNKVVRITGEYSSFIAVFLCCPYYVLEFPTIICFE